jgi:hypothetical protein
MAGGASSGRDPGLITPVWVTGVLKVMAGLLALVRPWDRALPRRALLAAAWSASRRSGLAVHAQGVMATASVRLSGRSGAGRGCQWAYPGKKFGEELLRLGERGEVSGVLDEGKPLGWRLNLGEVLLGQGGQGHHIGLALKE